MTVKRWVAIHCMTAVFVPRSVLCRFHAPCPCPCKWRSRSRRNPCLLSQNVCRICQWMRCVLRCAQSDEAGAPIAHTPKPAHSSTHSFSTTLLSRLTLMYCLCVWYLPPFRGLFFWDGLVHCCRFCVRCHSYSCFSLGMSPIGLGVVVDANNNPM